jgi:flavin-dependent dehydrogenase
LKEEKKGWDVIIVGGGLAGLTSALHLSKFGTSVLLIEKNTYPKHKVCGEYISNEVLPYYKSLGFDPFEYGAKKISTFHLSSPKSRSVETQLPLGGFGISRYEIDLILSEKCKESGVKIVHESVESIDFKDDQFQVKLKDKTTFLGKVCIGAYGKRSNIDVKLNRDFIKNKSPHLAVKVHMKGEFPENKVGLHNFKGGYCGVSMVETGNLNVCYIADFESFKKHKDLNDFQEKVVYKNKFLKEVFTNGELVFEKPITISQISFSDKKTVDHHILMCGDTAGMIHPLSGNGMGIAIRSAKIASELIIDYLNGTISSRQGLEDTYCRSWDKTFKRRIQKGHRLSTFFRVNGLAEIAMFFIKIMPFILPKVVSATHGKPMKPVQYD